MLVVRAVAIVAAAIQLEELQVVFPDVMKDGVSQNAEIGFRGDAKVSRSAAAHQVAVAIRHRWWAGFGCLARSGDLTGPHGRILATGGGTPICRKPKAEFHAQLIDP